MGEGNYVDDLYELLREFKEVVWAAEQAASRIEAAADRAQRASSNMDNAASVAESASRRMSSGSGW